MCRRDFEVNGIDGTNAAEHMVTVVFVVGFEENDGAVAMVFIHKNWVDTKTRF